MKMEVTKISSKGQVVIPEGIRKGIDVGTAFTVSKHDDLVILKKVGGLSKEELKELKELNKIWKEIDEGKCESYNEKKFFEKLKEW